MTPTLLLHRIWKNKYLLQVSPVVGVLGHVFSAPLTNPSISTHPSISCPSISDGHNQVASEEGENYIVDLTIHSICLFRTY